jgi:hypothetical protein
LGLERLIGGKNDLTLSNMDTITLEFERSAKLKKSNKKAKIVNEDSLDMSKILKRLDRIERRHCKVNENACLLQEKSVRSASSKKSSLKRRNRSNGTQGVKIKNISSYLRH